MVAARAWAVEAAIILVAAAFWLAVSLNLSATAVYGHYNLAFDFDPSRYVDLLANAPEHWVEPNASKEFWIKHPFFTAHRPIVQALTSVGFSPVWAVLGFGILIGSLSMAVVARLMRSLAMPMPVRAGVLGLFGSAATPVICASIPDAYGAALLGVLLVLWSVVERGRSDRAWTYWRFLTPVYLFGVTATNVIFAAIAEGAVQIWRRPLVAGIVSLALWGLGVGLLILILLVVTFPDVMLDAARDPIGAAKSVLWVGSLTPDPNNPAAGLLDLLETIFVFAFAAPAPSAVMIPAPGGGTLPMQDFRHFDFTSIGLVSALAWLAGLAIGAFAAAKALLREPTLRPLALAVLGMLAFNLMFHMLFQYRGSVFLYAGHYFAPVLLLFILGARQLQAWLGNALPAVLPAALLALTLTNGVNTWQQMSAVRDALMAAGY